MSKVKADYIMGLTYKETLFVIDSAVKTKNNIETDLGYFEFNENGVRICIGVFPRSLLETEYDIAVIGQEEELCMKELESVARNINVSFIEYLAVRKIL